MSFRRLIAAVIITALAPAVLASSATGAGPRRIELPGAPGKPFPYTVEIPAGWQMRQVEGIPGVWLGPADAQPPGDPRLVYVRISTTSLANPEQTAANIRAADEKQPWSAPEVAIKEVGGVRGVLVRMDSGEGDQARSTLVLKLPLEGGGVDFLGSAPRAEFEKLRPVYEQVLFSVRQRPAGK
ncbi:MAG TPA: hypothetical protein VEW48_07415 [Thermoanaerobaculia bacterium]|nr:hypothetical protein [Thermoanaerobaculia bacterium]